VIEVGDPVERRLQDDESTLHVEDAGTVDDPVLFTPGHRVPQLSDRPDRVVVPEEEQRRVGGPRSPAREVGDQMIAGGHRHAASGPAEFAVPVDETVGEGVEGLGVTGRCLVADVLPEPIDHHG
jgi:hypothetical protein